MNFWLLRDSNISSSSLINALCPKSPKRALAHGRIKARSRLLPSCVVWPPQNSSPGLRLPSRSSSSSPLSKRRGCGEVRAEGGRVVLCHRSAEVLVHIERPGRDRKEGVWTMVALIFWSALGFNFHPCRAYIHYAPTSTLVAFYEKNIHRRCQTQLVPQVTKVLVFYAQLLFEGIHF